MFTTDCAALGVGALLSEFDVGSGEAFQEGNARRGETAVRFSIRPKFGGAVVVILTNSVSLLARNDTLKLERPPPLGGVPKRRSVDVGDSARFHGILVELAVFAVLERVGVLLACAVWKTTRQMSAGWTFENRRAIRSRRGRTISPALSFFVTSRVDNEQLNDLLR